MQLNLIIDDWSMELEIPQHYLEEMGEAFDKMDRDMDRGWLLGQRWVADLNDLQRCQLAAARLLTAVETDNEPLALMMGGYILSRSPEVRRVVIDNKGEPEETRFEH